MEPSQERSADWQKLDRLHAKRMLDRSRSRSGASLDPATRLFNPISDMADSQYLNFIHQVSPAAIVQVLLKKGLITMAELEQEQLNIHEFQRQIAAVSSPNTIEKQPSSAHSSAKVRKRRTSRSSKTMWLKNRMAKFRWSRRLGTLLFGWKWKRISKGAA